MAARSTIAKIGQKANFKKAVTWGTAVSANVSGAGLNFKNISGVICSKDYHPLAEVDMPIAQFAYLGVDQPLDLSITTDMLYSPGALGTMMAMLFGTAGAPSGEGSAKTHTIKFASSISDLFGTLAIGVPGQIWEIPSVKPYSWSLKASAGGLIEGEIKAYGNKLVAPASTNTDLETATYDDRDNRLLFHQATLYVDDYDSEGSLTTTHRVNSFEFSFVRSMKADMAIGDTYCVEPVEAEQAKFSLKVGFPRYDANTGSLLSKMYSETYQMGKLIFEGATISGDDKYTLALWFPYMKIKPFGVQYEDVIKTEIEFDLLKASAAPTGFPDSMPALVLINKRTTDYLG